MWLADISRIAKPNRTTARLAIALLIAASACAQTALDSQSQTCSLAGTVVDAVTGQPLRDASVTARGYGAGWAGRASSGPGSGSGPTTGSAVADSNGRFSMENLSPGRYMVFATQEGYVGRGRDTSGWRTQILCVGSQDDIVIKLTPGAVISGQVLGNNSKALANVRIEALRQAYRSGKSEFRQVGMAVSDKSGEYRIPSLSPGKYYLRAVPRQAQKKTPPAKTSYVPVYFPGTPVQGGSSGLVVRAGEQMAGVAITLTTVRTVSVSGKVVTAPDKLSSAKTPSGQADLTLVEEGGVASWPYPTDVDEKGSFTITGLPAGNYVLLAERDGESDSDTSMWGQKTLQVGETDLRNVEVAMAPGVDLSGHIAVGGNGDVDVSHLTGVLDPVPNPATPSLSPNTENANVGADGGFVFHDVRPGNYRIYFFRPPGGSYYMKSARSPDILETGVTVLAGQPLRNLDFVLSPGAAHIDGTVALDQQPSSGVTVVLVPDGVRRAQPSYFRQTTSDSQGKFTLDNVPPGDYKLFAWQVVERGAYMDPEFLELYEDQGKSISLKEGASTTVQLDVIPAE